MPNESEKELAGRAAAKLVRDGDIVAFDVNARQLNVEISAGEMAARLNAWQPPAPRYKTGVMAKYANAVSSAATGAVTI